MTVSMTVSRNSRGEPRPLGDDVTDARCRK
jgi:hypothetical protein